MLIAHVRVIYQTAEQTKSPGLFRVREEPKSPVPQCPVPEPDPLCPVQPPRDQPGSGRAGWQLQPAH